MLAVSPSSFRQCVPDSRSKPFCILLLFDWFYFTPFIANPASRGHTRVYSQTVVAPSQHRTHSELSDPSPPLLGPSPQTVLPVWPPWRERPPPPDAAAEAPCGPAPPPAPRHGAPRLCPSPPPPPPRVRPTHRPGPSLRPTAKRGSRPAASGLSLYLLTSESLRESATEMEGTDTPNPVCPAGDFFFSFL